MLIIERKMEKYLIELLDKNNRVIVPELGAFIIRQNEPKELVFNDLLAFDDGLLTEYIIQVDKINKSEAQNRIRQYVDNIKKVLDAGDPFKLESIGTLSMDESSRIGFTPGKVAAQAQEPESSMPVEEPEAEPEEDPEKAQEVVEEPETEPETEEKPEAVEEPEANP